MIIHIFIHHIWHINDTTGKEMVIMHLEQMRSLVRLAKSDDDASEVSQRYRLTMET